MNMMISYQELVRTFLSICYLSVGVKTFAGINTKGGNMSDDISLAMEGALAVVAVVGVYCLVVFLMDRLGN